jgi:hypothetical protein
MAGGVLGEGPTHVEERRRIRQEGQGRREGLGIPGDQMDAPLLAGAELPLDVELDAGSPDRVGEPGRDAGAPGEGLGARREDGAGRPERLEEADADEGAQGRHGVEADEPGIDLHGDLTRGVP